MNSISTCPFRRISSFLSVYGLRKSLTLFPVLVLAATSHAGAAALTWDADTTTPGAQDGSGTWTPTSANFYNAATGADQAPVSGLDTITLGTGTAGVVTATITLNGGRPIFFASGLTINQNYTLQAATPGDGFTTNGTVSIAAGKTATLNSYDPFAVTYTINTGATLNISGGGSFGSLNTGGATSTFNINGGEYGINNASFNQSSTGVEVANINSGTIIKGAAPGVGSGQTTGSTTLNICPNYQLMGLRPV
jgi:hypothetical protein